MQAAQQDAAFLHHSKNDTNTQPLKNGIYRWHDQSIGKTALEPLGQEYFSARPLHLAGLIGV